MVSDSLCRLLLALLPLFFSGCGGMMNDLNPSGSDKQATVQSGTAGSSIGQAAPDFTLSDTLGNTVTLSTALTETTVNGVVLYFTMWCPTCDVHMSDMRSSIIPAYPNTRFYALDYVSGSVAGARNSELSNGYANSGFIVLADTDQTVIGLYQGTMGTTVVIDRTGIIRMHEDYKNDRLSALLSNLQ